MQRVMTEKFFKNCCFKGKKNGVMIGGGMGTSKTLFYETEDRTYLYADRVDPVEGKELMMPEKGDNCRSKILEKRRWHRAIRTGLLWKQRHFIDLTEETVKHMCTDTGR